MKVTLSELATIKTGLVLNRIKDSLQSKSKSNYKVISLKSFCDNGVYDHTYVDSFFTEHSIKENNFVKKGDIIIRLREPYIAIFIENSYENLVTSSLTAIIRVKSNVILPQYLTHYLNSHFTKQQLVTNSTISAINMIKIGDIQKLEIEIPTIECQRNLINSLNLLNYEEVLLKKLIAAKQKLRNSILGEIIKKG